MNPLQKYPHIIDLSACILNMFVFVFLCFYISLGTCSTPKSVVYECKQSHVKKVSYLPIRMTNSLEDFRKYEKLNFV